MQRANKGKGPRTPTTEYRTQINKQIKYEPDMREGARGRGCACAVYQKTTRWIGLLGVAGIEPLPVVCSARGGTDDKRGVLKTKTRTKTSKFFARAMAERTQDNDE